MIHRCNWNQTRPTTASCKKKVLEKVQECATMCKKHNHNTQVQLKYDMPNSGQAIAKKIILYRILKKVYQCNKVQNTSQVQLEFDQRPTTAIFKKLASNQMKLQYSEFKLYILPNLFILKPIMIPKLCFETQLDELSI